MRFQHPQPLALSQSSASEWVGDHGRRCRPGHAFIQNIRRGHYELGTHTNQHLRLAAAIDELANVI